MSAVAKKKKPALGLSDDKFEVRADPAFIDRLNRLATKRGMTRSAYVRMKLMEAMDLEEGGRIEPSSGDASCQ